MTQGLRDTVTDDLVQAYVHWREECTRASGAFRRWTAGPADEGPLAFAAYVAALDREELAAAECARLYARGAARRTRRRWLREWLGDAA